MSLTIGAGPFGSRPGVFNADLAAPDHLLYFEDSPRRVRVVVGGETVADSQRVRMLHESGQLPVYYFPVEDVRTELLQHSQRHTRSPGKGEAIHWSLTTGERAVPDLAWEYPRPVEQASWLAGYLAFDWDKVDAWYEEDEQIFVHPRDPYHRVDVRASSRHVRISLAGELLAESRSPKLLFETSLPPRFYLPPEDVRGELLAPSQTRTGCPYKGIARYWSVRLPDGILPDLVWAYPDPFHEGEPIRGLRCFNTERVDLEVDGERVARG